MNKEIYIPHLKYTIQVKDLSQLKGIEHKGAGFTCVVDENTACIFLQELETNRKKPEFISYIAHEALHAIQIMCEKFGMKVENEQEHTAYLLTYIIDEIIK